MHRNKFFLAFIIFISFVSLWFVGKAANELVHYLLIRESALAKVTEWSIEKASDNEFFVSGLFTFSYKDKDFYGKDHINEKYPNAWSAERGLKKISSKNNWTVWFNPLRPEKAIMVKNFPFKTTFSALLVIGLLFYFFYLGRKVSHMNQK